eukprot:scaffold240904_cov17-Prasinocladus_malaysianus.AAC.1
MVPPSMVAPSTLGLFSNILLVLATTHPFLALVALSSLALIDRLAMPSHVLTKTARLWGPTTSTYCLLPPTRCVSIYPQSRGRRCACVPTQDFG